MTLEFSEAMKVIEDIKLINSSSLDVILIAGEYSD